MKRKTYLAAILMALTLCACSVNEDYDAKIQSTEIDAEEQGSAVKEADIEESIEESMEESIGENIEEGEDEAGASEQEEFSAEEGQEQNIEESIQTEETPDSPIGEESSSQQEIQGYRYGNDGENIPVTIALNVVDVIRGEEAGQILSENSVKLPEPGEGEEYIIMTLNVTYVDGGAEILPFTENIASLPSANLTFVLSNGNSNAVNITAYLDDNIHDYEIPKGESIEGKVAFIHNIGADYPLIFYGFDNIVELNIGN